MRFISEEENKQLGDPHTLTIAKCVESGSSPMKPKASGLAPPCLPCSVNSSSWKYGICTQNTLITQGMLGQDSRAPMKPLFSQYLVSSGGTFSHSVYVYLT
jgi:hypothetical protein